MFDKTALHTNRKSIEYLYGQLAVTHGSEGILRMEDFEQSYLGHKWTENKSYIMQLLYLGSAQSERILSYFDAEYNGTALYVDIHPTLSPKDPAFLAWNGDVPSLGDGPTHRSASTKRRGRWRPSASLRSARRSRALLIAAAGGSETPNS